MFNRLKNFNLDNFLDSKIAEEEARRKGQTGTARPRQASAANRPNGRTASPRAAAGRAGPGDGARGPDPSEFVIDDDEGSTRATTPIPPEKPAADAAKAAEGGDETPAEGTMTEDTTQDTVKKTPVTEELSPEVQSKLRRLQKLESKYGDLLRSYRVAHARISAIEPFEASLRENTPLTSINDPSALPEYLAQINLKSDMIMQELKKVTEDRNAVKVKLTAAEGEAKKATQEAERLRKEKEKVAETTGQKDESKGDEFFSYDEDVPRLQAELDKATERVEQLVAENERLKTELAKTSADRQVEIDTATKQSGANAEAVQQKEVLESQLNASEAELKQATAVFDSITAKLELKTSAAASLSKRLEEITEPLQILKAEQEKSKTETADLTAQLTKAQNELESSSDKHASYEKEAQSTRAASDKKLDTLDNLVKTLRSQLSDAEAIKTGIEGELTMMREKVRSLEVDSKTAKDKDSATNDATISTLRADINRLERELDGAFDLLVSSGAVAELDLSVATAEEAAPASTPAPTPAAAEQGTTSAAAKKKAKNKKKKKGGAGGNAGGDTVESTATADVPAEPEVPTVSSPAVPSAIAGKLSAEHIEKLKARIAGSTSHASCDATIKELKEKLAEKAERLGVLDSEIKDKSSVIDRLHSKLKGEEDLREEIEGLKDDLMHIGNEHVGSKDRIKSLQAAKDAAESEHAENVKVLEDRCHKLKEEISGLETSLETQKEQDVRLQAELESLRTSSGSTGKELEAQLAGVNAEKEALTNRIEALEKDKAAVAKQKDEIENELSTLKGKTTSLQIDLNVANELAQARFKDLTALRDRLGKIQPEVNALKSEAERLKQANNELTKDNEKLRQLESRSESLKSDVATLKTRVENKDAEIKNLSDKVRKADQRIVELEDKEHRATRAQTKAETNQKDAIEARDKAMKDLSRTRDDLETARKRVQDLESQMSTLRSDISATKEELSLKSAQQASAQSLMDSMQDQTRELATQMKELKARCENLEEELGDSQRLLMERSREGETMRRLLADVEGKADARVKEMRDRLELAVEERDRAEEDASNVTRRKAREADELRNKLREAEKQRTAALEEREDFERQLAATQSQSRTLEQAASEAQKELEEVRSTMVQLRDSLDQADRERRELEKQRTELRKSVEDKDKRLDKLQKGSRTMADELKTLQTQVKAKPNSSGRPSLEAAGRSTTSPVQNGASGQAGMDYVYLKTVLLQFLEQKDRKHQMQLVPVLGMLLHFDGKDEQKWMTAINAK